MLSERFPENVMAQSLAAVQVTFGALRELTKNSPTNVFLHLTKRLVVSVHCFRNWLPLWM
jgi:hypothetical protein